MRRNFLQARRIGAHVGLPVQVHVEGKEIDKRQVEVFRGRVVDIREEAVGRCRLGLVIERSQEALHALRSVPAHDRPRDLVAQSEQQHGRVGRQASDLRHDLAPNLLAQAPIVEEGHVLRPR